VPAVAGCTGGFTGAGLAALLAPDDPAAWVVMDAKAALAMPEVPIFHLVERPAGSARPATASCTPTSKGYRFNFKPLVRVKQLVFAITVG
jgi:hypothetical protein